MIFDLKILYKINYSTQMKMTLALQIIVCDIHEGTEYNWEYL